MKRDRCSVGCNSDDPCGEIAGYSAEQWGRVSRDLDLCHKHACECVSDGWEVIDLATGEAFDPYPEENDNSLTNVL